MLPPPITSPSEVPWRHHRGNLVGDPVDRVEVEPETTLSGERLAGELQQDARVSELRHGRAHS